MITLLTNILAVLVAIGVLVTVHEFGHYWVARRVGIRVLRFSIGFGKPLWRRVGKGPDHTEFVISAIPLGGYVKMLDGRDCELQAHEAHKAFNAKPVPARIAVLLAGPAFNFFFAIAAYWVLFIAGIPALLPVIGDVTPNSHAARAGMQTGDTVVTVAGKPVANWLDVVIATFDDMVDDGRISMTLRAATGAERSIEMNVGDERTALTKPDALLPGLGLAQWYPDLEARINEVSPDSPAARAGLRHGDLITGADDQAFANWSDLVKYVQARPGERSVLALVRDNREIRVPVEIGSVSANGETRGLVGISPQPLAPEEVAKVWTVKRYGPIAAVGAAVGRTWDMSAFTVRTFGRMLVGDVSIKNISGPINIARVAGQQASVGALAFLSFLAILSISLGILNLLPVPILDGGQIVFQTVEWVKGSPLSPRTEIVGQQVGILLLLALMSVAFYNDLILLKG